MRGSRAGRELAWAGGAVIVALVLPFGPMAAEADAPGPAPPEILASAKEYAITKVGEEFYDSFITLHMSRFVPLKPENLGRWALPDWSRDSRYEVVYHLHIPDSPWVDAFCVVNIKEDGGWFSDVSAYEGLPNCVSDPGECEFPIDRDAAMEIAAQAGLEPGDRPWNALFCWSGQLRSQQTYVWRVDNLLLGTGGGRIITVDANSGDVLGEGEWGIAR